MAVTVAACSVNVDVTPESTAEQVLPDGSTGFSLDMEVVGTADTEVVYAVEQRARPDYRIFSFDPVTGEVVTMFTVPEDAIIRGIALSPDGGSLAVSYSPDFHINGSGIWLLDLETLEFSELSVQQTDIYLTEPEWSSDGESIFATRVDRTAETEVLDLAEVSAADGSTSTAVANGITPAVVGDDLYYLVVEEETQARREVGVITEAGESSTITVDDGSRDLDQLVADESGGLSVSVLEVQEIVPLSLGQSAQAHGNHQIPSTWWQVPAAGDGLTATEVGSEPVLVLDAVSEGDAIVYATGEGISVAVGTEQTSLIESRAISFVAG